MTVVMAYSTVSCPKYRQQMTGGKSAVSEMQSQKITQVNEEQVE